MGVGVEENVTELISPIYDSFVTTKHLCFEEFNWSLLCLDGGDVSPSLLAHNGICCFLADVTANGIVFDAVDANIIEEGVVDGKDSRSLGFGETRFKTVFLDLIDSYCKVRILGS